MEFIIQNQNELQFLELFEVLKKEYVPKNYSVFVFGIGKGRSIIVGQSFSVGVRVYLKSNNLIQIFPQFGSKWAPWFGVGLAFIISMNMKEKRILEKEVHDFIRSTYTNQKSNDENFETQFNRWMLRLNNTENPGVKISAFNFGIFETTSGYSIYLTGSEKFDEGNDDWATEVDFNPTEKYLAINPAETSGMNWSQVLNKTVKIISAYVHSSDFNESILNSAIAITTGFDDGNLTRIK